MSSTEPIAEKAWDGIDPNLVDKTLPLDVTTVARRIDHLGQLILARCITNIEKIEKGEELTDKEKLIEKGLLDQFKTIETVYNRLVKMGRIKGGKSAIEESKFDQELSKLLDKHKNSVSAIVRPMRKEE